jgi:hypothetical protein
LNFRNIKHSGNFLQWRSNGRSSNLFLLRKMHLTQAGEGSEVQSPNPSTHTAMVRLRGTCLPRAYGISHPIYRLSTGFFFSRRQEENHATRDENLVPFRRLPPPRLGRVGSLSPSVAADHPRPRVALLSSSASAPALLNPAPPPFHHKRTHQHQPLLPIEPLTATSTHR